MSYSDRRMISRRGLKVWKIVCCWRSLSGGQIDWGQLRNQLYAWVLLCGYLCLMISINSLRIASASAPSLTNHWRWTHSSNLWQIRISTCLSLMICPRLLNPISKIIRGWSAVILGSPHSWVSQYAALLRIWPIALLLSLPSYPMPFLNLLRRSTVYGSSIFRYLLLIDVCIWLF